MNAQDIIAMLAEDIGLNPNALTAEDCRSLRYALEDGAALEALGITDEDQEAVEAAHAALDERRLTYTVNDTGLAEIQEFLADNHKLGGDHFTADMLRAWAADAEFQLAEHLARGHLVHPMPIDRQLDPPVDDEAETLIGVAFAHHEGVRVDPAPA